MHIRQRDKPRLTLNRTEKLILNRGEGTNKRAVTIDNTVSVISVPSFTAVIGVRQNSRLTRLHIDRLTLETRNSDRRKNRR